MQIYPLSEGSFSVDGSKKFIPFNKSIDKIQDRSNGSILVEIQPFLVITGNDVLLLDTGLGFPGENGKMQLHEHLAEYGINPGDVTKVLMSHLHKDHVGGMFLPHFPELAFPNATYYIHQKEMDYAFEKGAPSYVTDQLTLLKENEQVTFLEEDNGSIDQYIQFELTGGHSPFHQVFWIRENNETVFFGGDVAPQLVQMKHRFAAKYDYDGKKAMELRTKWWEQGELENWTFLFYHDIKTPIWKF